MSAFEGKATLGLPKLRVPLLTAMLCNLELSRPANTYMGSEGSHENHSTRWHYRADRF
jgi:hypothetical protein